MSSKLVKENEFLRAIKICSITSFRGEEKLSVACYKILRNVKETCRYERDTS
jgi:hypothetical protein